jgi:ribosome-associated toxin RatA of RatAB toxin-antitoxin module
MPRVEVETFVRAPADRVYAVAKDVERFPEFMPDVESLRVVEREGNRTVTTWVGRIQGRRVRWTEEDWWDDERRRCTFRQREGDFDRFEGTWTFDEAAGGCAVRLCVDYELEIPLVGPMLAGLVRSLVRKNAESMLDALRRRAEETTPASGGS